MASSPLVVAGVAAGLLVVVVGVDVALERTYHVDVEEGTGWRTLGSYPFEDQYCCPPGETLSVQRGETYGFRLRTDSTYPWSWSGDYTVRLNGAVVADGRLDVPARGSSTVEFSATAAELLRNVPPVPGPEYTEPKYAARGGADIQVEAGGDSFGFYFEVVEVAA